MRFCLQLIGQLEENLKEEQRAVSEQEYVTFKELLTPMQVTRVLYCRQYFVLGFVAAVL